jgi:hypothetical protein
MNLPVQPAGYLAVGSYSPNEASFGEYDPKRFNVVPIAYTYQQARPMRSDIEHFSKKESVTVS